ncbi:MAG TPA: pyridoxamine 5'-phosphate oxidase [Actinomycetota bacterium]|nr:pyridoxamine 5'-phosphate oxidase [Actinomycetota bacterium]
MDPAPAGDAEDERPLELASLPSDPIVLFRRWNEDADRAGIRLPNAIALATASADGRPSVRHVLLRGVDERGFVFYTNHASRKGTELGGNPRAAFSVYWRELDRQISVTGDVTRVSDEESDAYFATRPREARLGAWASRQSAELASRDELMERFAMFDERYPGEDVPRPSFWGGYRIAPTTVEFWLGRGHRLHDRFRFERSGDDWVVRRLSP